MTKHEQPGKYIHIWTLLTLINSTSEFKPYLNFGYNGGDNVFFSLKEAEEHQLMLLLKEGKKYEIFQLDYPNPYYK